MNIKDWFRPKINYNPKCTWWIFTHHDFGRWEPVSQGKIVRGGMEIVGHFITQKRTCKNCHYVDMQHKEKISATGVRTFHSLFPETTNKPKGPLQ